MHRRGGFTLLELMIVVAVVAVLAATAIPSFVAAKIASNEAVAAASLRAYVSAQEMFHRTDHDKDGAFSYAVPYTDLYSAQAGGGIALIDQAFGRANAVSRAKAGYFFTDITRGAEGPFDKKSMYGLCASPALYGRTGRATFIVDPSATIYMNDLGDNIPVVDWPGNLQAKGWMALGG